MFHVSAEQTLADPTVRVVKLLQNLAKKAEEEGEKELQLYDKFQCWAKEVIDAKTASNADARSRIEELDTFVSDIAAARIEFTEERRDLTAEAKEINQDLESVKSVYKKDSDEFEAAIDEMKQALDALGEAIIVLKEATAKHSNGALFLQRSSSQVGMGYKMAVHDAALLGTAVEIGSRVLSPGDAAFLQRLLTGTHFVKPDWKKVNRKPIFKTSYKARSTRIMDVLLKLKATFSASLAAAEQKQSKAETEFETLKQAKTEEKEQVEDSLRKMVVESGAKEMNKEEAQEELDSLKTQVENDEKYIQQTTSSVAEKKEEWKERQKLRSGEIVAINKAIAILHADDARNTFKKSFNSQGFSLVQVSKVSSKLAAHRSSALAEIGRTAAAVSDRRLYSLMSRMSNVGAHFAEVVKSIDIMIADLKKEQEQDLENKEQCEQDRQADTRLAASKSRDIDEKVDDIARLQAEIAEIKKDIVEKQAAIDEEQAEINKAAEIREAETSEWQTTNEDDMEALAIVKEAKEVLSDFYSKNKLMLLQQPSPGEAPQPPPATWEEPYAGETKEAQGILAIMDMIINDINKDIADAKVVEETAEANFKKMKKQCQKQIKDLEADITELTEAQSGKEEKVQEKIQQQGVGKDELNDVMKKIKEEEPGCNYITVNYNLRRKNRYTEMDGLYKAKIFLGGGKFEDTGRSIVPGDAFLGVGLPG